MKRTLILVVVLSTMLLSFNGCHHHHHEPIVTPSGYIVSEYVRVAEFNELYLTSQMNAVVTVADSLSVRLEGSDNVLPYIRINESRGRIKFDFSDRVILKRHDVVVYITVPALNKIDLSDAAICRVNGKLITTGGFTSEVSGASSLSMDSVCASYINIEIHGASRLTGDLVASRIQTEVSGASLLSGRLDATTLDTHLHSSSSANILGEAEVFTVRLDGASNLVGYDFIAANLNINLSGASRAQLSVSHSMQVVATGASALYYKGSPAITSQTITGGSKLTQVH